MTENQIEEVFPYLRTRNANAAIEFYKQAFGAVEDFRLTDPNGRVGHAELKFGKATVMRSDEYPEYGIHGPTDSVPTGSSTHLHVDDVDAMTQQAVAAGAKLVMEPKDQFYGERSSKVLDPFGHEWGITTTLRAMSHEEIKAEAAKLFEGAHDSKQ